MTPLEHPGNLTLAEVVGILPGCRATGPDGLDAIRVTGAGLDSRRVRPGQVYAALPGANVHGASFAAQAIAAGAVAVLTDEAGARLITRDAPASVPVLVVDDPRAALAPLAAAIYGHPSRKLELVGITGTNGKTTTAYLLESAWRALGYVTGLVGTIEIRVAGESIRSVHTTPESPDLQALLALMAERGAGHCVMEVSSHALALHRADALDFDVAVFTNLSQDHLDFHGSMEAYFAAKAQLFTPQRARRAVICADDPWGRRLAGQARIPVTTLATPAWRPGEDGAARQADWQLVPGEGPGEFTLVPDRGQDADPGKLHLVSALPGTHNEINTALAALVLLTGGVPAASVEAAMAVRPRGPGRMELAELAGGGGDSAAPQLAVVDFAHTPDAIEATLGALRPVADRLGGPLVAVLGAGGDRDHGKRPLMGAAGARYADALVVTDDNPRREDPALIRAAVAAGARCEAGERGGRVCVIEVPGRAEGIARGLELAAGGVIAVLGKGHETTQVIGTTTQPFDDRVALAQAWEALRARSDSDSRQEG